MSRVNGPRRRVVPRLPVHYFGEKPYSRRTRLFSFGVPFAGCFPARPPRNGNYGTNSAKHRGPVSSHLYYLSHRSKADPLRRPRRPLVGTHATRSCDRLRGSAWRRNKQTGLMHAVRRKRASVRRSSPRIFLVVVAVRTCDTIAYLTRMSIPHGSRVRSTTAIG